MNVYRSNVLPKHGFDLSLKCGCAKTKFEI